MNEYKKKEQAEEMEIDVQELVSELWDKMWYLLVSAVMGAVAAFLITFLLITPLFQSSAMFYVNNSSLSVGDATFSIDSGDISASKSLVDSYIVILKTRESLNDVIDYSGVNRTYEELRSMISAASVNSTEIFEVVVTSPDPAEAEQIAKAIAYILPKRISSIIEGTSAKIVDSAVKATTPSSPSYTMNVLAGFAIGFALAAVFVMLQKLFDITIRSEEDIAQCCDHPVLASVPDMDAPSKGGYYYGAYGQEAAKKQGAAATGMVGSQVSFAASEAYKLLRTKLKYSFAAEKGCRVIGVSSALAGEGKSLSSINLAYSLSELGDRVLLIDCDMRRPSLPDKLPIKKKPGLSGFLAGQNTAESLIQNCGIPGSEKAFHVIASGQNPPNPIELLSSERMKELLDAFRKYYDYIILDLPPVGEVSDALAVANKADGVLLVVRQNYCNRIALSSTNRQFEFVNAHILGLVYNCASEGSGKYGKKYYKKYYNKASYAYANEAYRRADRRRETKANKGNDN